MMPYGITGLERVKPTTGGRSLEQRFSQPVGVTVKPVAVGDNVVVPFLSDGGHF